MKTSEILELYRARWNEINKANSHGNITIQRSHTALLILMAQTIEQLADRLIVLEELVKPTEFKAETAVEKIMRQTLGKK